MAPVFGVYIGAPISGDYHAKGSGSLSASSIILVEDSLAGMRVFYFTAQGLGARTASYNGQNNFLKGLEPLFWYSFLKTAYA